MALKLPGFVARQSSNSNAHAGAGRAFPAPSRSRWMPARRSSHAAPRSRATQTATRQVEIIAGQVWQFAGGAHTPRREQRNTKAARQSGRFNFSFRSTFDTLCLKVFQAGWHEHFQGRLGDRPPPPSDRVGARRRSSAEPIGALLWMPPATATAGGGVAGTRDMCTLNAAPPPQGYFIGSAASSSSALGGAGGAAALPVALVVSGMSRWDRWPVTAAASLSNPAHAHVSFHGSPPTGCISGSQRQKYLSQSASFLIDVHGHSGTAAAEYDGFRKRSVLARTHVQTDSVRARMLRPWSERSDSELPRNVPNWHEKRASAKNTRSFSVNSNAFGNCRISCHTTSSHCTKMGERSWSSCFRDACPHRSLNLCPKAHQSCHEVGRGRSSTLSCQTTKSERAALSARAFTPSRQEPRTPRCCGSRGRAESAPRPRAARCDPIHLSSGREPKRPPCAVSPR